MVRLLAVLVLLGASAQADTDGDWQYSVNDGEATITGYFGNGGEVTIPGELNGIPVRRIGIGQYSWPSLFFNKGVTGLTIENGIRELRPYALYYSTSLTNVNLPTSLTTIEEHSFRDCLSLKNINIPANVTNIGTGAFFNCTNLTSITIPEKTINIGGYAFSQCFSLTNLVIQNGVKNIGTLAFQRCTSLTNILIPLSVTNIETDAFDNTQPTSLVILNPDCQFSRLNADLSICTNIVVPLNRLIGLHGEFGSYTHDPRLNVQRALAQSIAHFLARDTNFISNLAQAILASSNNYGLATKTEVGGAVTMGVQQVLSAPSDYNLFTTQQVQNERTAGQNDVLNTPNSFSLYTTNQIHNLGLGGIVLNRNTNNQLVLNYQVLQSSDLQNWAPYQQTELVISNAPSDKMFLRVQAVENYPPPSSSGNPGNFDGSSDSGPTNPGGAGDGGMTGGGGSLGGN